MMSPKTPPPPPKTSTTTKTPTASEPPHSYNLWKGMFKLLSLIAVCTIIFTMRAYWMLQRAHDHVLTEFHDWKAEKQEQRRGRRKRRNRNKNNDGFHLESIQFKTPTQLQRDEQQKEIEMEMQFHNSTSPFVVQSSLFNCQAKDSKCQYFSPLEFFAQGQPGNKYLVNWTSMGGGMVDGRGLSHFHWSLADNNNNKHAKNNNNEDADVDNAIQSRSSYPWNLPHDITFYHIRKTGGTSVRSALEGLPSKMETITTFTASTVKASLERFTECGSTCEESIQALASTIQTTQQQLNQEPHVAFAILRDPVERFLSAIGEASRHKQGVPVLEKCVRPMQREEKDVQNNRLKKRRNLPSKNTTEDAEIVQCVLRVFHNWDDSLRRDIHFIPMSVNLATKAYNASVSVFPMEAISDILSYLQGSDSDLIHARDNGNGGEGDGSLSSSYAEVSLSMEKVLEDKRGAGLVEEICRMYAVDVDMMRSLGFELPHCR